MNRCRALCALRVLKSGKQPKAALKPRTGDLWAAVERTKQRTPFLFPPITVSFLGVLLAVRF